MISRSQCSLDVAAMLHGRERWSKYAAGSGDKDEQPMLWWFIDSSPQARRDLLLSVCDIMKAGDLIPLLQTCHRFANLRAADGEEHAHAQEALWSKLDACFERHVWPPTALGKSKSKLEDKFAAWMHSIWLDSGNAGLQQVLDRSMTITPDMGVESGLADVMAMNTSAMLPSWTLANAGLLPENFGAPDSKEDLQDDSLGQGPGAHADVDSDRTDHAFVFKRCLLIAGMNHIISNAEARH